MFATETVAAAVDLDDLNSPHSLAVLSVAPGATVLDIGCGPGVVAKALAARSCEVWAVEIDPRSAASARHSCVEVLEGDVEAISLSSAFGGMSFDVILCLDVLEHLRDPAATLLNATRVLAPGGRLLLSLPNVTHGALRLELLSGKFRYRDSGLLDRGHLRFFDAAGVDELIRQAGLRSEATLRVVRKLDQTEFDVDLTAIPDTIRQTLEQDLDALTYQFFVIARQGCAPQPEKISLSLLERQRARIGELTTGIERGAAYAKHVEAELAASNARQRDLEGTLERATAEFDAKAAHLAEQGAAYARHLEAELVAKNARLGELEDSLDRATGEFDAKAARLAEEGVLYAKHVEAELALKDSRLRELEGTLEHATREFDVKATQLAEQGAAYARHLEAELAAKNARLSELEESLDRATREFDANAARLAEEGALYAKHVEAELASKDSRLRELEQQVEQADGERAERATRLTDLERTVADLTRVHEDDAAYVHHLEDELSSRAGILAIRDDEASALRADVEMTKHALAARANELNVLRADGEIVQHTLAERTAELQIANDLLVQCQAGLEAALRTVDERGGLADQLAEILRQPRHRLVEMCNHSFKHRLPGLHRLVRSFVLPTLERSSSSGESPTQWP